MKKRAISLFLVVTMSFSLFYPSLTLNDNVCIAEYEEDEEVISLLKLLRASNSEKKFKFRLLEWIYELYE